MVCVLMLDLSSAVYAGEPEAGLVTLTGKASLLASRLKGLDVSADADAVEKLIVVESGPGVFEVLLPDTASRALVLDERLRNRDIEVKGRRIAGLPFLQVMSFMVQEDGRWRTPEYYCDVCTIQVRYPQICPCCQGPMELRMKPEAP